MVMVSETYVSEFIKVPELKGKPPQRLTIKAVHAVTLRKAAIELAFHATKKRLTLNKTSATALQAAFGDNTDTWVGKDVLLKAGQVKFGPGMVDAVLVEPAGTNNTHGQPTAGAARGTSASFDRNVYADGCVEKFNEGKQGNRLYYLITLDNGGLTFFAWTWPKVAETAKAIVGTGQVMRFFYKKHLKDGKERLELLAIEDAPEVPVGAAVQDDAQDLPDEDDIPF